MLLPASSSVTTAQPTLHTNPSMEPNDSLEIQQPFLEEVRDLEASMGHTETPITRGGRSQPPIPDGMNMRWLLRHDPQYTERMHNLDYDKKVNDKALMANCWKHQHIRKLVEACPSRDAGVVKVRDWFKLLVESRTPSDQSRDTTYVEQIFWAGKNLHAANEEHFESLLVASGAADASMATLFARDADLATAIYRARNSPQYRFCTTVNRKNRVLQLSLNESYDDDRAIEPSTCHQMVSKILSCRFQDVLVCCSLFLMALLLCTFVAMFVIALMEPSQRYCKYYEEFYLNSTNAERHLVADD
ncbi:hypothetical protein B0T11DRAFT_298031 [Plectosphaerella cucumerina]|uniref:Uncharacterized protein n=1 Tax=Plectosphaerella cucumerina TaxID=40658 RepID=A0A8K0TFH8_9PEZI|nr:hypothetical protein B0T11DRAFT_298031 [Plectosphaerella cucumerina]